MGGRCAIHVPSCGRQTCLLLLVALLPPRAWPLLIKVYWAIQIWYEVCICLGLSEFSFSYRNIVGTGGFSGRAIMRPRDVVLLLCPLVTPTPTLLRLGLLLPLSTHHSLTHSTPPGLAVLRSHQALEASTHYFSLVCFFPSPPPFTYPFHTTRSGSASLTSST